ncbi:MAG: hypothetical protein KDB53_17315 [Planctomycetes bacterium]|nr:hypothetical protein [Planctomycetota bacterium]
MVSESRVRPGEDFFAESWRESPEFYGQGFHRMPELPEVERGRRLAEQTLLGRRITGVSCADDEIVFQGEPPSVFEGVLKGRRVEAVRRRGKQLWFVLDSPPHPLFHFGMTVCFHRPGSATLSLATGPKNPDASWPPRFTKIHLTADDGGELVMTSARRLGRIRLRQAPEAEPPIVHLGFDPLIVPVSADEFAQALGRRKGRLKGLLLDQRFCAGIGNWIADEVLYQAALDPRRAANDLTDDEARLLHHWLILVVETAVAVDAEKDRLPRGWLFHSRWGRKPGAVTARGEAIEHLILGGRSTAWVPARQR